MPNLFRITAACLETTGCDQGQMRCYLGSRSQEECCNFYDNNMCVAECPSPFVGDSETYDCGKYKNSWSCCVQCFAMIARS